MADPGSADEGEVDESVRAIWDYMRVGDPTEIARGIDDGKGKPKADAVLCLGSSDIRVATFAAGLFLRSNAGIATWLVFSGGIGTGPHSGKNLMGWDRPEAEVFADEAVRCGVPRHRILTEPNSKNTGENIKFCYKLLQENGVTTVRSLVLVQKPFMERRTRATFLKQWPAAPIPAIAVTSPPIGWPAYLEGSGVPRDDVISILVGDLQRIKLYAAPPTEYQVPQHIPDAVWAHYEALVKAGFTKNLIDRA